MNPLWANPDHEFDFVGKRPRFFEKKVGAPLGRMSTKQRCHSGLKFQPVLYRCDLNGDGRAKARLTFRQASAGSGSKLNDCRWFFVASLREGISNAEEQRN